MNNGNARKKGVDFLRFISCIGILFLHFTNYLCPNGVYFGDLLIDAARDDNIGINMNVMVEVFFAISGFLIYSYSYKLKGEMSFFEYIIPRLTRILPLLTIGTILLEIIVILYAKDAGTMVMDISYPYLWGIITSCLGIEYCGLFVPAEINHESWFLDVLIICYVMFYAVVKISKKIKINEKYGYALMVVLGIILISGEMEYPYGASRIGRGLEAFFAAVLLAPFIGDPAISKKKVIVSCGVVITYLSLLIFLPQMLSFGKTHIYSFFIAPALLSIFTSKWADIVFTWRGWERLGRICFSTYILHVFLIYLILFITAIIGIKVDFAHEVFLLLYILLAFMLGALAYYFIEKRINRILINKFIAFQKKN